MGMRIPKTLSSFSKVILSHSSDFSQFKLEAYQWKSLRGMFMEIAFGTKFCKQTSNVSVSIWRIAGPSSSGKRASTGHAEAVAKEPGQRRSPYRSVFSRLLLLQANPLGVFD